jgi:hypothetical protein
MLPVIAKGDDNYVPENGLFVPKPLTTGSKCATILQNTRPQGRAFRISRGDILMMKTAIVSCYFIHNYGSALQAYATQRYLDGIGVDCTTVSAEGLQGILGRAKKK